MITFLDFTAIDYRQLDKIPSTMFLHFFIAHVRGFTIFIIDCRVFIVLISPYILSYNFNCKNNIQFWTIFLIERKVMDKSVLWIKQFIGNKLDEMNDTKSQKKN